MKKNIFKERNFKKNLLKLLNKEGFYVAIFLCITLIATSVVYFTNNNVEKDLAEDSNPEITESTNEEENISDVSKIINEEVEETEEEIVEELQQAQDVIEDIQVQESNNSNTVNKSDTLDNLQNPVNSNEVVMAFSYGVEPVFSNTLNEFRSDHTGVDLKAEIGEEVKAALDGKVIKIYDDVKLGKTVVIQHSNNIETRYSNLDKNISVTLNQSVKVGESIGKVGKTANFEADDDPHLHFELWKDGKCIDPMPYLS